MNYKFTKVLILVFFSLFYLLLNPKGVLAGCAWDHNTTSGIPCSTDEDCKSYCHCSDVSYTCNAYGGKSVKFVGTTCVKSAGSSSGFCGGEYYCGDSCAPQDCGCPGGGSGVGSINGKVCNSTSPDSDSDCVGETFSPEVPSTGINIDYWGVNTGDDPATAWIVEENNTDIGGRIPYNHPTKYYFSPGKRGKYGIRIVLDGVSGWQPYKCKTWYRDGQLFTSEGTDVCYFYVNYSGDDSGSYFAIVPALTPTPTPLPCAINFNVSCAGSGTQATISWNPISGASGYLLRVNKQPYNDWFGPGDLWLEPVNPSQTFNITPATNYQYDVQGKAPGEPYPYSGARCPFEIFNCPTTTPTPTRTPTPTSTPTPTRTPTPTFTPTPTPTPLPQDPWFQVKGGNAYAKERIRDDVPPGETFNIGITDKAGAATTYYGVSFLCREDGKGRHANTSSFPEAGFWTYPFLYDRFILTYYEASSTNHYITLTSTFLTPSDIPQKGSLGNTKVYYRNGDLTLNGNWTDFEGNMVVFVNGRLTINTNVTVKEGFFLSFVVQGGTLGTQQGIVVNPSVTQVQGFYLTDQKIHTGHKGSGNDSQIIFSGTFVANNGFSFQRDLGSPDLNRANPAQVFEHRPDFAFSSPEEFLRSLRYWSEGPP